MQPLSRRGAARQDLWRRSQWAGTCRREACCSVRGGRCGVVSYNLYRYRYIAPACPAPAPDTRVPSPPPHALRSSRQRERTDRVRDRSRLSRGQRPYTTFRPNMARSRWRAPMRRAHVSVSLLRPGARLPTAPVDAIASPSFAVFSSVLRFSPCTSRGRLLLAAKRNKLHDLRWFPELGCRSVPDV